MPYTSVSQLPEGVKDNLPVGAKRIWMNAYNAAYKKKKQFKDDAARARYAWGAVKKRYTKSGNKWVSKQ